MAGNFVDLETYVKLALAHARVECEGGEWFAEIPGFVGVWAVGPNPEAALKELGGVLRGWLQLKLEAGDEDIPEVDRAKLASARA